MSVFPKETVHAIAETQGITLKDEVASVLLQDAEYRLREIIHEATKFMRHSHRRTLTTDDINSALSVRNVEPIYGFISGSSANFKSTVHNNQTLYYLEDQEYDLEDLINRPLPPVPIEPTYTAHWLAIDGVQPRIVQNPTPSATEMAPLVKQVLTKELQMYYEKITEMLINDDPEIRALAIESTGRDPGMQGLMPYFVQFVADTVTRNLKNLDILWAMMRFMRALLANPDLDPEPYLHQMIPSILTCIVAKRLSLLPSQDHYALRLYASQLASHICVHFGAAYPTLQPRITKTLLRALLDSHKPLPTVYGAVAALAALGTEVVKALILPNVASLAARIDAAIRTADRGGHEDAAGLASSPEAAADLRHDAAKTRGIVVDTVVRHLRALVRDRVAVALAAVEDGHPAPHDVDRTAVLASLREQWSPHFGSLAGPIFEQLQADA